MLETIRNAWKIADLRKKILYTLLIVIVFRIGSAIPVPFMNAAVLQEFMNNASSGSFMGYLNLMTGGSLSRATLFALGI
ncbi:MAG: preprotein translocase subunit SecY, partial [Oscillospiraceae bacterium]